MIDKVNDKALELPEAAADLIHYYENLGLGGKKVVCPYYINTNRSKDLRAMVGKGLPGEIEMEAKIWEKLKGVKFRDMSRLEIREFLINRGIGIDCSGFVTHVLDKWYFSKTGKHIWRCLKIPNKSLLFRLFYLLKPVEKLGAEIITNEENSYAIKIQDVKPGDLIRAKWKLKNSHHVMLVSRVYKNAAGNVSGIEYVSSTRYYGENNGVKYGEIEVVDPDWPLQNQKWTETDKGGVNHTFEGYMIQVEDNGLRRLKCMEALRKS